MMKLFESVMKIGGFKKYTPINEVSEEKLRSLGFKKYLKTEPVWARQMDDEFTVDTLEGDDITGKPGDFLCVGVENELWPIAQDIFKKTYKEVE